MIKQSRTGTNFKKKMADLGYEIKYGKHIAFKPKDKARFTKGLKQSEKINRRKIKDRIAEESLSRLPAVKNASAMLLT